MAYAPRNNINKGKQIKQKHLFDKNYVEHIRFPCHFL